MFFRAMKYRLAEKWRLTRALTIARVWNYLSILGGFWWSRLTRQVWVKGMPFALTLETCAACNLRCPECMTGKGLTYRNFNLMDFGLIKSIVTFHRSTAFYVHLFFQGEPFIHPQLPDIIELLARNKMYSVISTNGHFLDTANCKAVVNAGLDRVIISLDGISPETYQHYREGGDFYKVVEGIKTLARIRGELKQTNPLIEVQFLVNRCNEKEMTSAKDFVRHLGADLLSFKSMQFYSQEGRKKLAPITKSFNRYTDSGEVKVLGRKKGFACFRLWSHMVYTSDGVVVPCCYDKLGEFEMGTYADGAKAWNSRAFRRFREQVLKNQQLVSICNNCKP